MHMKRFVDTTCSMPDTMARHGEAYMSLSSPRGCTDCSPCVHGEVTVHVRCMYGACTVVIRGEYQLLL